MTDIRGKVVLITGAAMGMGKLLAEKFVADGARVILVDVNREELIKTAADLGTPETGVLEYVADVSDRPSVAALRDWVHREIGPIDVLVNNAGIVSGGPFLEVPIEQHIKTIEVNLNGLMCMTHVFLPDLVEKQSGHIVMLASAAGFVGVPAASSYAASKWAVIGFTESVRLELEREGLYDIKFTIACPGFVDTGMFAGVKAPLLAAVLEPETIADTIYAAFKQDNLWVIEPAVVKTVPLIRAVLPTFVADRLGDLLGMNRSMDTWIGRND